MNIYEKWMDFSTRLIALMDVTGERREKILNEVSNFIEMFEDEEIRGWDTTTEYKYYGEYCIGSIADDSIHFGEYRIISEDCEFGGKFYNQISAVTRAGLDVATEEFGGGVIGYTIGDLQDMYTNEIPDWVKNSVGITGKEDRDIGVWL